MRRAGVVVDRWSAVVVADGAAAPLPLLLRESFEVGQLVDISERPAELSDRPRTDRRFGALDKWRRIDPEDLDAAAQRILDTVRDCERVVVRLPKPSSPLWRLGERLRDALEADGARVIFARRPHAGSRVEDRSGPEIERIREVFAESAVDWYTVQREAAGLICVDVDPTYRFGVSRQDYDEAHERRTLDYMERLAIHERLLRDQSGRPLPVDIDAPVESYANAEGGRRSKRRDREEPEETEAPPRRQGVTLRAGIDPGSSHLALVIVEGDSEPLKLRLAKTYSVGGLVPLSTPKVTVHPDGSRTRETHRRSVTARHVDAVCSAVMADLTEHGVERATIEHVDQVYVPHGRAGSAASIATALARTAWVSGALGERIRAAGIELCHVSNGTWRSKVAPFRAAKLDPQLLRHRVEEAIEGWAEHGGNEHERDAAGIAVFDLRLDLQAKVAPKIPRVLMPKLPRVYIPKKLRSPDDPGIMPSRKRAELTDEDLIERAFLTQSERGREKRKRKREELGCTCPISVRRHRIGCKLYAPKVYAKARPSVCTCDLSRGLPVPVHAHRHLEHLPELHSHQGNCLLVARARQKVQREAREARNGKPQKAPRPPGAPRPPKPPRTPEQIAENKAKARARVQAWRERKRSEREACCSEPPKPPRARPSQADRDAVDAWLAAREARKAAESAASDVSLDAPPAPEQVFPNG